MGGDRSGMGSKVLPVALLVGLGLLGLVAAAQWQRRHWLGPARWLARQTSPHLLVGIPMASILLLTLAATELWAPAVVLAALAAMAFLVVVSGSARRARRAEGTAAPLRAPATPPRRTARGTPPESSQPPPRWEPASPAHPDHPASA